MVLIPTLQMGKLRYREVKQLVLGHTAIKGAARDLSPGILTPGQV